MSDALGDRPYVPPPYPYDRLDKIKEIARRHSNGGIDLSIGAPSDPPPQSVIDAMSASGAERGYPPSIGTNAYREAAAEWLNRRTGTNLTAHDVRATVGSKEFVAGLPHYLKLRRPDLDTVLYPAVSYPSYAMGATLGHCRSVAVPVDENWRLRLDAIDPADADRALCLWINSPGNPTGAVEDLEAAARWGRGRGIPVFSDECYIEFTWQGPPASILQHGTDGVVAVHSLSKRSNLAGARAGVYAGDPELLEYLGETRKHAGFMVPGPMQHAGVVAFGDHDHVENQRLIYRARLERGITVLKERIGVDVPMPEGGFYLWAQAPERDSWAFAELLASELGIVTSPGDFYGGAATDHVRIAMVRDIS
ncbi:MAG: aminotransferase class I/II-fold pyridoxal phosphate-dependent enzyme [Acidimicrobiales bacterium]|nr:aminotransferase class I/II-fold pyridoxal phosphate-dependent enzyme [Acidimicrobiales bacterium]